VNSKLTSFIITALLGTATAVLTPSAQAQIIALNDVVNTSFGNAERGSDSTVGFQFTLTSSVTLDSLGLYVPYSGAAYGLSNPVGLFDSSGNLLAEAFIPVTNAIDEPEGSFVYLNVNPSMFQNGFSGILSADTTYEVGVSGPTTDGTPTGPPYDFYVDDKASTFTPATGLNVLNSVYSIDPGFNAPLVVDITGAAAYVGPNFTFSAAVPEPSTYALMFGGLGALAMVMRSRRTRA